MIYDMRYTNMWGVVMFFLLILCIMFGEIMIQSASFDTGKIETFIYKITKAKGPKFDYFSRIERGKEVFDAVFQGQIYSHSFDRITYLNNIIALMWYFYAIVIEKDQGFTSGVMILEDNDQKIYQFLHHYIKQVNPKRLLRRSLISMNPYGYSRRSTHFPRDQEKFIQYGIDIRFTPYQKAQQFLPAFRTHILFGRLNHGLTFVKFERHGLYAKDGFVGHAFGFLNHVIKQTISKFVARKERSLERKEYMPEWVKQECRKLGLKMSNIKKIRDIVQIHHKDQRLNDFIARLAQKYDHLGMRYGGEVILSRAEMDQYADL